MVPFLRVEKTRCLVILQLVLLDSKAVRKGRGNWGQSGSHSEKFVLLTWAVNRVQRKVGTQPRENT